MKRIKGMFGMAFPRRTQRLECAGRSGNSPACGRAVLHTSPAKTPWHTPKRHVKSRHLMR
eukprot:1031084-Rhodomonas_salina.2